MSVSIALEVLDIISRQNQPTKHPIIFLFNGAEEKGMLVMIQNITNYIIFKFLILILYDHIRELMDLLPNTFGVK